VSLIKRLFRSGATPHQAILMTPHYLLSVQRCKQRIIEGSARQLNVPQAGSWQASVEALRTLLQQNATHPLRLPLEISISGRWSQLAMAPWSEQLLRPATAQAFLQLQLMALYGEAVQHWQISSDDAPYGQPRLVCGTERALLQALRDVVSQTGHRCHRIEPVLGNLLRTLSPALAPVRTTAWQAAPPATLQALAIIESGRLTIATLETGRVTTVQSQPVSEAWRTELPQAWRRCSVRTPELASIERVAVVNLTPATPHAAALHLVPEALPEPFFLCAAPFGEAPVAQAILPAAYADGTLAAEGRR
jgi:hypothetical protein